MMGRNKEGCGPNFVTVVSCIYDSAQRSSAPPREIVKKNHFPATKSVQKGEVSDPRAGYFVNEVPCPPVLRFTISWRTGGLSVQYCVCRQLPPVGELILALALISFTNGWKFSVGVSATSTLLNVDRSGAGAAACAYQAE